MREAFPKLFLRHTNNANTAYGRLLTLIKTPNVEPDIIWAAYEAFHRLLPSAPREHAHVYNPRHALDRSVLDWRIVRRQADGRLPANERWARLASPHPFEYQMRTILQDIREIAHTPMFSDYHWVLFQLAAAGHATATEQVCGRQLRSLCSPRPIHRSCERASGDWTQGCPTLHSKKYIGL